MITYDPKLAEALEVARLVCRKLAPAYFRPGILAVSFVQSDLVPTFGIDDKWRVYVSPAFAATLSPQEIAAVILHEVLHPTFRHGPRAKRVGATDHATWNKGADLEINPKIPAGRLPLPKGALFPHMFGLPDNLTAEQYYAALRQQSPQSNKGDGKQGSAAEGGDPSEGSGASGKPGAWEAEADVAAAEGKAPKGVSQTRAAALRGQIAREMKATEARSRGSVPAAWLRWADEVLMPPRIPWELALGGHLQQGVLSRVGAHSSYARPSRRMAPGGMVLPVHRTPRPKIAIVGDTSGSMRASDIAKILGTVRDACLTVGRVWAVACDSHAGSAVEVSSVEDLRKHLTGGGGTDMRIGIRAALQIQPDIVCVVTDGDTPWPHTAPEVPVVIVRTRGHGVTPSWAKTVDAF